MLPIAKPGDWVQIRQTVLEAGERAPQVPPDTKEVPLELWVKGFIDEPAQVGNRVTITTLTGRKVTGELVRVNPAYEHDFGRPVPELLPIGLELRKILFGGGEEK